MNALELLTESSDRERRLDLNSSFTEFSTRSDLDIGRFFSMHSLAFRTSVFRVELDSFVNYLLRPWHVNCALEFTLKQGGLNLNYHRLAPISGLNHRLFHEAA